MPEHRDGRTDTIELRSPEVWVHWSVDLLELVCKAEVQELIVNCDGVLMV